MLNENCGRGTPRAETPTTVNENCRASSAENEQPARVMDRRHAPGALREDAGRTIQEQLAQAILACIRAGISVIPIDHRTKRPYYSLLPKDSEGKPTWKPFQQQIVDEATAKQWCASGIQGFAVVTGEVSGGLLVLDFDVERFYWAWREGVGELADGLPVQRTGGGGFQVFLRCENPGGNDKLAWAPDEREKTGRTIAIETRGQGGYAVVPPSLHPSGNRYEMVTGSLSDIPVISQARADALVAAARKLDECPHTRQECERLEQEAREAHQKRQARSNGHASVIEAFNAAHPIEDVLAAHGYTRGPGGRYIRPGGKSESVSIQDGRSCHWSSNDPLNDGKVKSGCGVHDAFDVHCHYEYGGDVKAAVRTVAEQLGMADAASRRTETSLMRLPHGIPYEANESGITWHKPIRGGSVPVLLTNFTARIVADVVRDDGAEREAAFEIEAVSGSRRVRLTLLVGRFASLSWPLEHLGAEAIIYPGQAVRDNARAAIQLLSPRPIPRRTVYTHTGWRKLDNMGGQGIQTWAYLHGGGAIEPSGKVEGIEVELPEALSLFILPDPPQGEDLKRSIQASLGMLELAADDIVVPVFCGIWRAVIAPGDFGLYLAGPSGVFKSELAALAQQHFGPALDARHLPGSWHSTDNALEGLLFSAKDAIVVVDDFAPCGAPHDIARWHQRADRVLRAQGNNSGRGRMRADGSLRPPKPPRGLVLSTGEDIPRGQSLRARLFILEISQGDIDKGVLTRCQQQARAGRYASAMAGYVQYLASRYQQIRQGLRAEVENLRREALDCPHCRTPEIIANLAVGLKHFIAYAVEAGALSEMEGKALWDRAWKALGLAAQKQTAHQKANEPATRFVELLRSAISSGHAHLAGRDGCAPVNPAAWGWRGSEASTNGLTYWTWRPQGDRVGWVNGEDVFLDPDASFRAAQAMAGAGGDGLAVSARTLRKRMDEKDMLVKEEHKDTLTVRRVLDGATRKVLYLAKGILSAEPDIPDNPDANPAGGAEDQAECQISMSEKLLWPPGNLTSNPTSSPDGGAESPADGRNVRNVRKAGDIPPSENSDADEIGVMEL